MFAARAAVTKGGVATNKVITGLKGAVTGILKPTADMSRMFEDMGGPMKAIQELGFQGFLQKIQEETGGSAEELGKLFGSVEGLASVLTLTGSAADDFTKNLEEMAHASGAVD